MGGSIPSALAKTREAALLIEREIGAGPEAVYAYYFPSQKTAFSFPHKIGRAKSDPIRRIKDQQASMQEVPVIGTLVRCQSGVALEQHLHLRFKDRQLPTFGEEWFDIHPDAIANALAEGPAMLAWNLQLQRHRVIAGMTQAELADTAGLRQATVSRVESGADVNIRTVLEMCRELKLRLTFVPL